MDVRKGTNCIPKDVVMTKRIHALTWVLVLVLPLFIASVANSQPAADTTSCNCDFSEVSGAVWWGSNPEMTVQELASYVAPILWFSPDEPSLSGRHGPDLSLPEAFPFQEAQGPVVYYQLKEVLRNVLDDISADVVAYTPDSTDKGASVLNLARASLMRLEYYAYFAEEAGLGAHLHDVEPVEFKLGVAWSDGDYLKNQGYEEQQCDERHYVLLVTRVSGKAHGIEWFWNIVEVDDESRFPMTLLVEEGKHALATDKNGDGYFTPSYDVNVRINDAWGVRDIIRSGGLFAGGYQAWMTKVRHPRDRVFPPLPEDSPISRALAERHVEYTNGNAVYELRPLPPTSEAAAYDAEQGPHSHLVGFITDKEVPDGPKQEDLTSVKQAFGWIESGALKRSLSIALYADGDLGFSWVFPFFIVKNLYVPMSGGYIMQRMYAKDDDLRDFGWMAMYTPSASRWIDTYFAAGVEWHTDSENDQLMKRTDFVLETGLKFRAQIGHSPLKFLSVLTDFWGFRAGVKNYGFFDIDRLTYVFELGAGSF
jgi:hypothetical protein